MPEENTEIVRELMDVWNQAGWPGVADKGLLDPEVDYRDDERWPEARSAHGIAELLERFDEILDVLGEESRAELERIVEAPDDQVVAIFRFTGEARASGLQHDYRWGWVFRIAGGRVDRIRAYLDPEEALRAAGV